jgi:hypothetical protein
MYLFVKILWFLICFFIFRQPKFWLAGSTYLLHGSSGRLVARWTSVKRALLTYSSHSIQFLTQIAKIGLQISDQQNWTSDSSIAIKLAENNRPKKGNFHSFSLHFVMKFRRFDKFFAKSCENSWVVGISTVLASLLFLLN